MSETALPFLYFREGSAFSLIFFLYDTGRMVGGVLTPSTNGSHTFIMAVPDIDIHLFSSLQKPPPHPSTRVSKDSDRWGRWYGVRRGGDGRESEVCANGWSDVHNSVESRTLIILPVYGKGCDLRTSFAIDW